MAAIVCHLNSHTRLSQLFSGQTPCLVNSMLQLQCLANPFIVHDQYMHEKLCMLHLATGLELLKGGSNQGENMRV